MTQNTDSTQQYLPVRARVHVDSINRLQRTQLSVPVDTLEAYPLTVFFWPYAHVNAIGCDRGRWEYCCKLVHVVHMYIVYTAGHNSGGPLGSVIVSRRKRRSAKNTSVDYQSEKCVEVGFDAAERYEFIVNQFILLLLWPRSRRK